MNQGWGPQGQQGYNYGPQGHGPPQGYGPPQGHGPPPQPKKPPVWLFVLAGLFGSCVCVSVLGNSGKGAQSPSSSTDTRPAQTPPSETKPARAGTPAPEAAPAMVVPVAKLLGDYENNEVRGDGLYKGKLVQITGHVGDVKKDILNDIYITVGTGQMFEIPMVQCFVKKGQADQAASLSKGDKVTVKGKVSGLMMNVLVKECEIL